MVSILVYGTEDTGSNPVKPVFEQYLDFILSNIIAIYLSLKIFNSNNSDFSYILVVPIIFKV